MLTIASWLGVASFVTFIAIIASALYAASVNDWRGVVEDMFLPLLIGFCALVGLQQVLAFSGSLAHLPKLQYAVIALLAAIVFAFEMQLLLCYLVDQARGMWWPLSLLERFKPITMPPLWLCGIAFFAYCIEQFALWKA